MFLKNSSFTNMELYMGVPNLEDVFSTVSLCLTAETTLQGLGLLFAS